MKFRGRPDQLPTLANWLRMNPAGFRVAYPQGRINNIYFDSHEMGSLADHLGGVSERSKVRLRWYGHSRWPESAVLEIKSRRNEFGWKRRFALRGRPEPAVSDWRTIWCDLRRQVEPEGRSWLESHSVAIVLNRYRRAYWLSSDGRIRVTVDTEQAAWDQRRRRLPNLLHSIVDPEFVVEVKFEREDREVASRVLARVPLTRIRNSKYLRSFEAHRLE